MVHPAEAILASSIYTSHHRHQDQDHVNEKDARPRKRRRRVGTGCAALDGVLRDGIVYGDGGICCISGDGDSGVNEILQSLLLTHLLSPHSPTSNKTSKPDSASEWALRSSAASATIIDSKGGFDVLRLHDGITGRLASSLSAASALKQDTDVVGLAGTILDRVRIMRVFDMDGLLEGIAEMKADLEGQGVDAARARDGRGAGVIRSTIADSQDEMLDDMLDDIPPLPPPPPPLSPGLAVPEAVKGGAEGAEVRKSDIIETTGEDEDGRGYHMLIVDNLTQLMTPLIKNNYVQGHALLTTFLRSLAHTARRHNICVLLLNSASTYKDDQDLPSAFSSIVSRPALGKTLDHMIDTHLFINRIPKTQRNGKAGSSGGRLAQRVSAVEVLQDADHGDDYDYDDRVGRVGLFTVDDDGSVKDAF